jgi:uncharacterized lipoprotein YmbA
MKATHAAFSAAVLFRALLLAALALPVSACTFSLLPQRGTDATRYYVLSLAPPPPRPAGAAADSPAPAAASAARRATVSVAGMRLPAYLDRSEIVLRPAENRLDALSSDLWLEHLGKACARVFTHDLALRLGGGAPAALAGSGHAGGNGVVVRADIVQFEGYPGEFVLLRARWTLSKADDDETPLSADECEVRVPLQGKPGVENYVNGMSRALDEFAGVVAQDIRRALPAAKW